METKAIPMLGLLDAQAAIELYKNALGAEVVDVSYDPDTSYISHAEILVYHTQIMLHDIRFQAKIHKTAVPPPIDKYLRPFSFYVRVVDADSAFNKAVENGMEVEQPINDSFWGERFGMVIDKFGIGWGFATPLAPSNKI